MTPDSPPKRSKTNADTVAFLVQRPQSVRVLVRRLVTDEAIKFFGCVLPVARLCLFDDVCQRLEGVG